MAGCTEANLAVEDSRKVSRVWLFVDRAPCPRARSIRGCSGFRQVAPEVPVRRERRSYIRRSEIIALEQQGQVAGLGECVGRTIDDVELRLVTLPLAKELEGVEGRLGHGLVKRDHDNSRDVQSAHAG